MNRQELEAYILETYGVEKHCPWARYPSYAVFRHTGNGKWFAVLMELPGERLGLSGGVLDVVNLKCDPMLVGTLRREPGFFPAYHMNKENWITAALDGSIPDDKLKLLLDMSFAATAGKPKRRGSE